AVDVYETEPKLPQELISHPSMLPTPHIAAMTEEAHKNMAIMPAKKLIHTIQEEQEILFVCMGNSERSAIAETLYNKLSQTHRAYSAGTNVTTSPRNSHIYEILQEENIDIQNKQKQQLNEELFNHATKVYVLCDKKHCPEYVINSKKVIYWDVKDPYDEDKSFLSMTRDIIKKHIEEIL
ncbi:MAG: hypothetical protein U9Q15_04890, partial [Patescibacteria group bacterium]|nr:hypothetical protein [Patescibacteria group bacterium]